MTTEVVVVDDDAAVRELVKRTLRSAGYDVQTAADGRQGLITIVTQAPTLVLTDIVMPELDG